MRPTALALLLATAASAAEIPAGAHALLRMVNAVSTRTAREGESEAARFTWAQAVCSAAGSVSRSRRLGAMQDAGPGDRSGSRGSKGESWFAAEAIGEPAQPFQKLRFSEAQ